MSVMFGRLADAAIAGAVGTLPRHPRTGIRALGFRKDGRPIWPIAGARETPRERLANPSPFLAALYAEQDEVADFMDRTVQGAMTGGPEGKRRDLSASERETLDRSRKRIADLDEQIEPLEDFETIKYRGDKVAQKYSGRGTEGDGDTDQGGEGRRPGRTGLGAQVNHRAHVYPSAGHCIVDQLKAAPAQMGGEGDAGARERLLSAGVIFAGVSDADVAVARSNTAAEADRVNRAYQDAAHRDPTQSRVTQVTADTPGILPVPVIGGIMSDIDASRPFINSVGAQGMAFAGDSFKRPVITQHSAVGKQTTQATTTGMGTQKLVIGSVTFAKETWGGWLDVSRQDIDWTSPAAWNAIVADLQDQYGMQTENTAADAFNAAVVATVENADPTAGPLTLINVIKALYAAAALAYGGAGRLPDTIWCSLDMWSSLGPLIEAQVSTNNQPGQTQVGSFVGELLKLPRIVVPSFSNGTLIIGAKRWTEVYEERIGLLQVVNPSILGVQVAYGGYVAYNTLKPAAFAKVINAV